MLKRFRDKFLLEITVFISGALVMIFEIVGSRILAPYIGTSTYVWTSLIGVILASLSLGYWLGGKMADRRPDIKVLSAVLFAAGVCLSITIFFHQFILSFISDSSARLEVKSLIATLLLFAPASILFGFIPPYAIRLKMQDIADSGKTVGRLYAISTMGSILGTFSAGFFLLPFVGSLKTLYLIASILFALSLLLAPFSVRVGNIFAILLLPAAILLNEAMAFISFRAIELRDIDTEYARLRIFRAENEEDGRPVRVLANSIFAAESAMYLDGDGLALNYTRYYHLLRYLKPDFQKTLMIGGAGYSFPKSYLKSYPAAGIDVVEIDKGITRLAREYFELKDDPRLQIFHEDGRVFLNRIEKGKYDAILIDAFGAVYSVPFQLATREAVEKMYFGLAEDGIVILNLISAINGKRSLFLQAEYQTYKEIFPYLYLIKADSGKPDDQTQNLIIIACKKECFPGKTSDAEILKLLENRYSAPLELNTPVLTDDLAPTEYYNSFAKKE